MTTTGRDGLLRHLPNALTLARLAAVPIFAVLVLEADGRPSPAAAAVFAFAAVTDFLDGELSRRLQAQTRLGRVLDPIADRLLIDVAAVLLWLDGRVPLILVAIVLGRDLLLVGSLLLRDGRRHGVRVNVVGKAGTLVTMFGLLLAMLTPPATGATLVVLWSGVALLVVGGVLYARSAIRQRAAG
jgi:CDP-diacylglycerol--glycerol-3-phosphate 3-phosphatidyltransferase